MPTLVMESAEIARLEALARAEAPREALALLLGRDDAQRILVMAAVALPNVAAEPERSFAMDPRAWPPVRREAAARGLDILGFFHSHPEGPERPSAADLAAARALFPAGPSWPMLLATRRFDRSWALSAWRLAGPEAAPLALEIA